MKFNDSETRGEKKLIWSEINKEKGYISYPYLVKKVLFEIIQ